MSIQTFMRRPYRAPPPHGPLYLIDDAILR